MIPRHFLVKRHKSCGVNVTFVHNLQKVQDGAGNDTHPDTITDADKQILVRDCDYISDYADYSSPDSGYVASPNNICSSYTREKENLATEHVNHNNNNNNNVREGSSSSNFYENGLENCSNITVANGSSNSTNKDNSCLQIFEHEDTPLDLSMCIRDKSIPYSIPAHSQQNHIQHKSQCQQQQQHQLNHCPRSTNLSAFVIQDTDPVSHFQWCNNLNENYINHKHICPERTSFVSSQSTYTPFALGNFPPSNGHLPSLCLGGNGNTSHETEIITGPKALTCAEYVSVPIMKEKLYSSTLSLSPSSTSPSPLDSVNDSAVSLRTSSPVHSPKRKRIISGESEKNNNEHLLEDNSKTMLMMKTRDSIRASITPPTSREIPAEKTRATYPAVKKAHVSMSNGKKLKAVRRLNFEMDTTSPVSGTIIKNADDLQQEEGKITYGDIEASFNLVEVTPEARAELEKIDNRIGDYICQLCKEFFEDAFQLAQHRCSRIVHVEYKCPECEKVFNCPANLASHRRWHKPQVKEHNKLSNIALTTDILVKQKQLILSEANADDLNEKASMIETAFPSKMFVAKDDISEKSSDVFSFNETKSQPTSFENSSLEFDVRDMCNLGNTQNISGMPDFTTVPQNKSHRQVNGFSVIVSPYESLTSSSETSPNIRSTSQSQILFTSNSDHDSNQRLISMINPLHNKAIISRSTLTAEERSLVFQVLNSHNRQQVTESTASTIAVLLPHASDSQVSTLNTNSYNVNHNSNKHSCDLVGTNESETTISRDNTTTSSTETAESLIHPFSSVSSVPPQKSLSSAQNSDKDQEKHQNQIPQEQTVLTERQGNRQNECFICGKKFQRQAYLRKHIVSRHSTQNGATKFDETIGKHNETERITTSPGIVATGKSSDHLSCKTTIICSYCGKMFASEPARRKHLVITHGNSLHLKCTTCSLTFSRKTTLDKHIRSAHAAEIYSCKHCSSTFHSSPGLTRHTNKYHPTENNKVILLQLPAARTC